MQKVIEYKIVEHIDVHKYLDKGWQPWGNAMIYWNGLRKTPHQPMVKYEEGSSSPRPFKEDWENLGSP